MSHYAKVSKMPQVQRYAHINTHFLTHFYELCYLQNSGTVLHIPFYIEDSDQFNTHELLYLSCTLQHARQVILANVHHDET